MNLVEGLFQAATEPRMAPHVGEVFSIWTYYTALTNARDVCMVLANHSADKEVREIIEHLVSEVEDPQIKQVSAVMKAEGIPFPAGVPEHPLADEKQVPFGAKFTDSEIANLLVAKIEALLFICHNALAQSLRDDIGAMFLRFHTQLVTQGFTMKKTMKTRGWLLVPPTFMGNTASNRPAN